MRLPKHSKRTLTEGQSVVVPIAVGMGAKVRNTAMGPDDAEIGALAVEGITDEKRALPCVDAGNHLFPCPFHPSGVAQMGNMLR